MHIAVLIVGVSVVLLTLWEAFETIVLPRRVERKVRITRYFYIFTWYPWKRIGRRISKRKTREYILGLYGPVSLLFLFIVWGIAIVFGYGLIYWGAAVPFRLETQLGGRLFSSLYFSATTFITLGLGDVVPANIFSRILTAMEAANGLGFFAVVIGYLPTLYQSFSRREVNISLLDSRAGSPPSAVELLRRHAAQGDLSGINALFGNWEVWAAELMESHISYPALCYFRSQHTNQSWVAALTAILDCCALVMATVDTIPKWQAQLTFAMARHALVDITQIFSRNPAPLLTDRLPPELFKMSQDKLAEVGIHVIASTEALAHLRSLRDMYEPYAHALSDFLAVDMPPWFRAEKAKDNWTTSAWKNIH